jgi:hypothetical protein
MDAAQSAMTRSDAAVDANTIGHVHFRIGRAIGLSMEALQQLLSTDDIWGNLN